MNSGMESKLTSFMKKMTRGKSIVPPMMVFMGTAGGAYYLFKQKGAENRPSDDLTKAENGATNHPSEDLTKSKMPSAPAPLDPTEN